MDQDIIIDSLAKQLDLLENLTKWSILFGLAVVWTGLNRRDDFDLLGLKAKRRDSLYIAGIAFVFANIIVIIEFLRINSLLLLLRGQVKSIVAITKLTTHTWLFNPFGYFGPHSNVYAGAGFGLLIVLWWFAYSALTSLFDEENKRHSRVISVIFLATGLCSLAAIQSSTIALLKISMDFNDVLKINLYYLFGWRIVTTLLGIIVGMSVYLITLRMKSIFALETSRIRERAYYIWLDSGQSSGKSEEHWNQARQECERELGRK